MSRGWPATRRLLAVRLDAMGDVLMTEPALAALRDGGQRHVTLLTSRAGARVAPLLAGVDEAIAYDAPWMKASEPHDPGTDLRLVERLRCGAYDGAVIFTVSTQSPLPAALTCYLAGIPLRAARGRDKPYALLTEWMFEDEPRVERHEVERQLALVRKLGFTTAREHMEVRLSAADRGAARRALAAAGLNPDRPWLVLHPGASAPSRRYPAASFAIAADRLALDDGWQVVLIGGAEDRQVTDEVASAMATRPIRLQTGGVGELAAVIGGADVFLGNNSGPMHLAAAVGTPVVVTYALTNPQHTPWMVRARVLSHDVPCRNCQSSACPMGHHACLLGVPPRAVVDAVREVMQQAVSVPA